MVRSKPFSHLYRDYHPPTFIVRLRDDLADFVLTGEAEEVQSATAGASKGMHAYLSPSRKNTHLSQREPLASSFSCLFCNHENSVIVKLDKKLGLGDLSCKVCGQKFQTGINCGCPLEWFCPIVLNSPFPRSFSRRGCLFRLGGCVRCSREGHC